MIVRDYRDLCIEQLADEFAAATERIALLSEAVDVYRLIALEVVARLREHRVTQQRLEARLDALRDELRRYTAAATGAARAA